MSGLKTLQGIVSANRAGTHAGIASWCTAHPDTLRAILRANGDSTSPILIEATCNQVNHRGGYTGMTPVMFRKFVEGLAAAEGVNTNRIILGGDHLGPNPWKNKPAAEAMAEARHMVKAYVEAGFSKIHLDASMACADDRNLTEEEMAQRAAEFCAVAEREATEPLAYVIGTEVPVPGGETDALDTIAVTKPAAVQRTFDVHKSAFKKLNLDDALTRVIGLVVQPGVDFDNTSVTLYDATKSAALTASAAILPGASFEAHSTDYQTQSSLAGLVAGHFAILKVGPELTFAYREAVFAMAAIEDQLELPTRSNIVAVIDAEMNNDDHNWRSYVPVGAQQRVLKLFGLSDRVRYYWPNPNIGKALALLQQNINTASVPTGMIQQFASLECLAKSHLPLSQRIIDSKVGAVVRKYLSACSKPALKF
jgi:D-tagatose-bisphosphate aldolase class II non-catalytic subunit